MVCTLNTPRVTIVSKEAAKLVEMRSSSSLLPELECMDDESLFSVEEIEPL